MSEVDGHFSLQRDGVVNIQLAARPGDEVRGLVADHGQELDEEVGGVAPRRSIVPDMLVGLAAGAGASNGCYSRAQRRAGLFAGAMDGRATVGPLVGRSGRRRLSGMEFRASSWSPNSRRIASVSALASPSQRTVRG